MPSEVVDTNVLFVASAAQSLDGTPVTPTSDPVVMLTVLQWLRAFRTDSTRTLVMDLPEQTILLEYRNKLRHDHYGRQVVQHKFDTGALEWVELTYWSNGNERVAHLPDSDLNQHFHDLGDRKIVAAASVASAPIVNATDGDWEEPDVVAGLARLGIEVIQLLSPEQRLACKTR